MNTLVVHDPALVLSNRCEPILRALPDWFGNEEGIVHYVEAIDGLPTLMATEAGQDIGFLSLQINGDHSADAYVLGVLGDRHRGGVGTAMFEAGERWLANRGIRFLQVKTAGANHECPAYEKTRRFYHRLVFVELETFDRMPDWPCPCLVMIKAIDPT